MIRLLLLLGLLALPAMASAQDQAGTVAAPFLALGVDARGSAMGSAQSATTQGAAALYWNPAAIASSTARAGTGTALFSNGEWFVHTRRQFAGLTFNGGELGTIGLSVTAVDYGDEPVTTIDQPEGTGEQYSALDLAVGLSYARALTERFSVGTTVKLVRQQIWNEGATGAAVDLGVLYETGYRGLRIGMSMANFGTDMKLSGRDLRQRVDIAPTQGGNNDGLPAALETNAWRMPLVFRVGVAGDAFRTPDQYLLLSVEGQAPSDNSQSANVGAEFGFRDLLYLRGGYRQAFSSVAQDGGWAFGFGLAYDFTDRLGLSVDYVFQEYDPFGTPQMFTLGVTY